MNTKQLLNADWDRLQVLAGNGHRIRTPLSVFYPRFSYIFLIRVAHAAHVRGWRNFAKLLALLNFILFGIETPTTLAIGPGLIIPHPQGIILGAASIGADVTIYQQVTLGAKAADFMYDPATRPTVEDGVTITAGAKVLGAVTLGRNCVVGANAVVLNDVPAGATAIGVPARLLHPTKE